MMTNTSSNEWKMLSKLTVPLNGLSCWRQIDPRGHRNPFPSVVPLTRLLRDWGLSILTQGKVAPVKLFKWPPQNSNSFVYEAVRLNGSRGFSHTHCRLRLALKLWMPMIANRSQKKLMRNATRTSRGVAFFRLRRMIFAFVSYLLPWNECELWEHLLQFRG